jgi:hypothetical protein
MQRAHTFWRSVQVYGGWSIQVAQVRIHSVQSRYDVGSGWRRALRFSFALPRPLCCRHGVVEKIYGPCVALSLPFCSMHQNNLPQEGRGVSPAACVHEKRQEIKKKDGLTSTAGGVPCGTQMFLAR